MRHPLDWLLRLAVPKDDRPAVLGDLSEEYERRIRPHRSWLGAQAWYVGELCAAVGFALIGRLRQLCRAVATFRLEAVWQDLRYAVRLARRQPAFAISAIVTLTLGIAGAAATFTIFDRVLLQPLPYPDPDRIVALTNGVWPQFGPTGVSLSKEITALPQFTALGMYQPGGLNLGDADHPERLPAAAVDSGFFRTLGVQPLVGRFFTSDDDRRQRVAVVAFDTWRALFNADRSLVGRDIRLNGRSYRVVGVMPRGFTFPNNTAVWVPPGVDAQIVGIAYMPTVIGRLASGTSTGEAMAAIARAEEPNGIRVPGTPPGKATPLHDDLVKGPRPTLIALVGLSALLLLSASANVAGLLAVRLRGRRREFVVRATLGASRGRLVRQVLTESLALVTIASIGGSTLALWAVRLFASSIPTFAPDVDLTTLDARFLAVAVMASGLGALLFTVVPVWSSPPVRASGDDVPRQAPFARGLVVTQVAAAVVLLVATTTAATTLMRLMRVDLGLHDPETVIFRLTPPAASYGGKIRPEPGPTNDFVVRLEDRLRGEQMVSHVGATTAEPGSSDVLLSVPLPDVASGGSAASTRPWALRLGATPDYFRAMGIRLIAGRFFTATDGPHAPPVVIISESAARHLASDTMNVIRERIDLNRGSTGPPRLAEVVGIVGDVRLYGPKADQHPQIYEPITQSEWITGLAVAVEARGPADSVIEVTRHAIHDVDPELPIDRIVRLADINARFLPTERLTLTLASGFATMSLILSAVGLFGVLTQLVADRTKEIGIRMALGAPRTRVRASILASGLALAVLGATLGALASSAVFRMTATVVPDLGTPRPLAIAGCVVALLTIAVVACWVPARRASAIDPSCALRFD